MRGLATARSNDVSNSNDTRNRSPRLAVLPFLGATILAVTLLMAPLTALAATYSWSTFAGTGAGGFVDGDATATARFQVPKGLALGPDGALYVADSDNIAIRKILDGGGGRLVSTFASSAAGLWLPTDVSSDSDGNVYVTGNANGRIVKIAPSGAATTLATGITSRGSVVSADGLHLFVATDGQVWDYLISDGTRTLVAGELGSTSGLDGIGAAARFNGPTGITRDADGNLYVADNAGHTVRRIDHATRAVTTIAGLDGSAGFVNGPGADARFSSPWGITCDSVSGDLFVADRANGCARRLHFDGSAWQVTALSAQNVCPNAAGIAVGTDGSVYLSSSTDRRIIVGTLPRPVYPISASAHATGVFKAAWGTWGLADGEFSQPRGVAVAPSGDVYVADTDNNRIQVFGAAGGYIAQFGGYGAGDGQFDFPMRVAVAPNGDVYVADTFNNRIQYFTADGVYKGQFGSIGAGDGQFAQPGGVAVAPNGDVYVADTNNHRIQVFSAEGVYHSRFGSFGAGDGQMAGPQSLAVAPGGDVYVADSGNNRVQIFRAGVYQGRIGGPGDEAGQFHSPAGVAVAPDGYVYVSDTYNNRVQMFDSAGLYKSTWGRADREPGTGGGEFNDPQGLAVAPNGDVYVPEWGNHRVQLFGARGTISPSGISSANEGEAATFTFASDEGYGVIALTVDGAPAYPTGGAYVFPSVNASHTISVEFGLSPHTLTYSAGDGGSITGASTQIMELGSDGTTVTAVPATGFRFVVWSDGVTTAARRDLSVTLDKALTAHFTDVPGLPYQYGAQEFAALAADGGADADLLGLAVAISGDTAVAGACGADGMVPDSGTAYIYTRSGDTWTQRARLDASDGSAGDFFGYSVAISGDTVVVGAFDDSDAEMCAGAAYVFTGSGATWTQQAKLLAEDRANGDYFGSSVAISGDTAVIGAREASNMGYQSGSAYVFTRSGTTWTQQAELASAGEAAEDWFGMSVAIFGDTAVIGAAKDDDRGTDSGAAFVFTRTGTAWSQEATLTASDGAAQDWFGCSVALSGDTAVVGAVQDDDSGDASGSAFVFTRSGTTWTEQAKLLASDGAAADCFGNSVAIFGDTAVVGAAPDDDQGADSGSAFVFTRSGTTWTQQTKLLASDGVASDYFGYSVAVSGDTAMVGACNAANVGIRSGKVYFFGSGYPLTLEYAAGANGSIAGPVTQAVASGSSGTTVTAVPNEGHHFVKWSDDVMTAARCDMNVTASIAATATFAINSYTVTTTVGPHGSISPTGPITMDWGTSQRFDFTPDPGYHVEQVIADGYDFGASPWLVFGQTESDHLLSVTFAINSYRLTYEAGQNGTLSGTASQTVTFGSDGTTVTAVPDASYRFEGWSDGYPNAERRETGVSADATYTATFRLSGVSRDDTVTAYSRPTWVTPLANDDAEVGAIDSFTQGSNGAVTEPGDAPAGSLLYTPAAGYLGADSFTYTTSSGTTATVRITVVPDISAPRSVEAARTTTRSVTVTWVEPLSLGSGFVSYQVVWRSQGQEIWNECDLITDAATRSCAVTGLAPGVTYEFGVTVADTGGYTATSPLAELLLVGDSPEPIVPPTTTTGENTATVPIGGLSQSASLTVDPQDADGVPGLRAFRISGLSVQLIPEPGFTGVLDLPVTVLQDGTETTIHVRVTVNPADPYDVTFGPASATRTFVQWAGSLGATGYRIFVGGSQVATVGAGTSSFTYRRLLGPNTGVTVQAMGAGDTASSQVRATYRLAVAVRIGTITFKPNSSRLTAAGRLTLRRLASLIKAQGFTSVTIKGVTGKGIHGSAAFRKRLATARGTAARTYLLSRLKILNCSVKVSVVTSTGSAIASKYRRAEIAVR